MKSWFTSFILFALVSTIGYTQVTNKLDNLQVGTLTTKTIDVTSTVKASKPCPKMTLAERNAIVGPLEGQCVYNSTAKTLNLYDGVAWVEVAGGGDGGIANWQTGTFYDVDDVVIYSGNIYQCITLHTSGASFDPSKFNILAQDLASATGSLDASKVGTGDISNTEFSYLNNASSEIQTQLNGKEPTITTLPLNKGGTNKNATASAGSVVYSDADSFELSSVGTAGQYLQSNGSSAPSWSSVSVNDAGFSGVLSLGKGGTSKSLTANNGSIAYSDADSFELLAPGTSGQILQSNGAAAPSFVNKSISAKSESSAAVSLEEIQVYNDQLTQTAAGKHKIETGNKNILVNPSFEHATFSTGWTNSAGTFAEDLIVEVDGLKAASVVLSSQTLNLRQDSTLYQAQFADGIQGLASARVKTSVSGVKLCARKAGTTQTSLCVSHTGSGKWELLKVPFILGGTSNGLVIQTDANVSGTVYVDDAFVGAQDVKVDGQIQTFSEAVRSTTLSTVSGINKITSLSSSISKGYALWDNANQRFNIFDKINGVVRIYAESTIFDGTVELGVRVNGGAFERVVLIAGQLSSGSQTIGFTGQLPKTFNNGDTVEVFYSTALSRNLTRIVATIEASSPTSTYSSTNADTDWQDCGHTTSDISGFGTVSNIQTQCKREGSDLLIKGKFTSGTPTSAEARVNLKLNGTVLTSAGTSKIPSIQIAGTAVTNNVGSVSTFFSLIEPSVSYISFGFRDSISREPLTKQSGQIFTANGLQFVVNARVPIQGWEQSNILIGQFNGLESCKDSYECTDTFSAKFSSTATTSDESIEWVTGNGTIPATGRFSYSFKTDLFTVAPNCTCSVGPIGATAQDFTCSINSVTTSGVILNITNNGVAINTNHTLVCQKQGVDYIGKTAKAVASDQNVRTPGLVNVGVHAFRLSSSCGLEKSSLSGATSSGTATSLGCTINFPTTTWSDIYFCGGSSTWSGSNDQYVVTNSLSNTSYGFYTRYNGLAGGNATTWIYCMGVLK